MNFSTLLIHWYKQNKRDLPWRDTRNPYSIWLSEIILQQTRVSQGLPYFISFTTTFPTVFDLANANEEQVLKLWQGLGYYSRARNLHKTAQIVAFENNGVFPNNYIDLQKLKGIGSYTAAAIASFAFNEVVAVVDGNVFRVLARYFDVDTDIASNSAKKEFFDIAMELIPKNDPAQFNQAIMEFGALQCVPKNPDCGICIFNESCAALQKNKVGILPVKLKKSKVRDRFLNYIIYVDEKNQTQIQKRTEKGIWHNLYEFPLIETEKAESFDYISENLNIENKIISIQEMNSESIIHKLSHQKLHIKFWKVTINRYLKNGIDFEKISSFPYPIVIANFLEREIENFI